jgi:HK97 family phage major capsid protein
MAGVVRAFCCSTPAAEGETTMPETSPVLSQERRRRADHEIQRAGFDTSVLSQPENEATGQEIMAQRTSMRNAHRSIFDRITRENRDLTEAEDDACHLLADWINASNNELDLREGKGIPMNQARPLAGQAQFPTGRSGSSRAGDDRGSMNALRPNERIEDFFAEREGYVRGSAAGIGMAQLLRASVTGDWGSIPGEVRSQMGTDVGTGGGFLVPSRLSARIIDLSRARARVVQAGALTLPIMGPTSFATVESEPEPEWRAEHAEVAESELTLGDRVFKPETLAVIVRLSVELAEDAPNASALIEEAIAAQLALKLDRMCLFGDGIGKPLGLYNTTGQDGKPAVNRINLNGPLEDYDPLSRAVEQIADNNAEAGDFLLAARTSGEIDRLKDLDGNPLRPPRSVSDRRFLTTNQIPTNLEIEGASPPITDGSAIFVGQWADYYVAVRSPITIEATRLAGDAFKKMEILVRGYLRADAFSVRPQHFTVVDGITPPPAA